MDSAPNLKQAGRSLTTYLRGLIPLKTYYALRLHVSVVCTAILQGHACGGTCATQQSLPVVTYLHESFFRS